MRPLHDILRGKKAVFFDLDGTLIDSIGVWNETDRILHRELTGGEGEVAALQALRDEALRRFRDEENPYLHYCALLKEQYGTALSARQIYERRYAIARGLLRKLDYKPGADAFLRALKAAGYTLALTTTTRRRSIDVYRTENRNILAKAPLDELFGRIYACEDVDRIKPDPQIYRRALADLGLAPGECLVFEDALVGVQAARAADLDVAVLYDKYSDPDRDRINALADWQVESYPALMDALGWDERRKTYEEA